MSNYTTNGFLHYHPPGSKEAAWLDKMAIADWKSPLEKQISLSPDDDEFSCTVTVHLAKSQIASKLFQFNLSFKRKISLFLNEDT